MADYSKLAGAFVWIWNWRNCDGGDLDAVAARLRTAGARGVFIKATDGGGWFDQGVPVSQLIQGLRARGFVVGTWGYNYDRDPQAEANIEALTVTAGPDVQIADVEAEFEVSPNAPADALALAQRLGAAAAKAGTELAYAPLPAVRYHLRLPYYQFSDQAGWACIPQLYWTGLGWTWQQTNQFFFQDVGAYGLSGPFFPAYQDTPGAQPTAADILDWAQDLKTRGCQGFSVWSYEHLDAGGWERFAAAAALFQDAVPVPQPKQGFDDSARWQLVKYVAGGSGVGDLTQWLGGYTDVPVVGP